MSQTIDKRVVEMSFDNSNFEKNVSQSVSTLDKLKKALKLDGVGKGLQEIDQATKGINLSSLSDGVEALQRRFSVLGEIGHNAMMKVATSVTNLSTSLFRFVADGIKSGGISRAMNLEKANFQLQGLLKDNEQVAAIMQNVSDSVDGTAYSLDAAAMAASMFAATGMRAGDQMYSALRAVAGVAAMTSSEYSDVSRIFTTVAGQGRVMADQLNQLAARGLNAAATMTDYFNKVGITTNATEADIRKLVSEGKVSFEMFAAAMDDAFGEHAKAANETFTGAMANIRSALARIGADFVSPLVKQNGALVGLFNAIRVRVNDIRKETTPFANEVTTALIGIIEKFTELIQVADLTPIFTIFGNVVDTLKNVFTGLYSIISPIASAFKSIFPISLVSVIVDITTAIKNLTSEFGLNLGEMTKVRSTFMGIFSIFDLVGQALSAILRFISPVFSSLDNGLSGLFSGVLNVTSSFGNWLTNIARVAKANDVFYNSLIWLKNALISAKDAFTGYFKSFTSAIKDKFQLPSFDTFKTSVLDLLSLLKQNIVNPSLDIVLSLLDRLRERFKQVIEIASKFKEAVGRVFDDLGNKIANSSFTINLESMWNTVTRIFSAIIKAIGGLVSAIAKTFGNADFSGFKDLFNMLITGGLSLGLKKFIDGLTAVTKDADGLMKSFKGIFSELKGVLKSFQESIKADILLKIASAVGILAGSVIALSMIDSDRLNSAIGGLTMLVAELVGAMTALDKFVGDAKSVSKLGSAMTKFAAAILILAYAMKQLASLDWEGIAKGLTGIGGLVLELTFAIQSMAGIDKSVNKTSTAIIKIAIALKILASVVEDLSEISWEGIGKGLTGIGGLLLELDLFLNTAKFDQKRVSSTAFGLIELGAALKIMASVMNDISSLSWENVGKGLTAIGGLLTELMGFMRLTDGVKGSFSKGLALIEIAAAMKIFASVMNDISGLSWEDVGKGLTVVGGALLEFSLGLNAMKGTLGASAAMVVATLALLMLVPVMERMSALSWEEIGKGLIVIGGAILELSLGLNAMKGTLGASAAMLVASIAILALVPAISMLSSLSWEGIAKALITIAGAFTILGIAGALLGPLVPSILGLSGALALLGVGVLAIGGGLALAGIGLTSLATGILALASALTGSVTVIVGGISSIILGIAELIPSIAVKIGEGIIAIAGVIAEGAPAIAEAIKAIILSLVDVMVECVPALANGLLVTIDSVLESLVAYTPGIIDKLITLIIQVIEGITARLPELVSKVIDLIAVFFSSIIDALGGMDTDMLISAIEGIGLVSLMMIAFAGLSTLAGPAMVGVLEVGAVIVELAAVLAAIGALNQIPGLNWLVNEGGALLEAIGNAIGKFVGGIIGGAMEAVSNSFPKIATNLSEFMTNLEPFIEGARGIDSSITDGVNAIIGTILVLTATNILDAISAFLTGGRSIEQFGKQIVKFGESMAEFSNTVTGIDVEAVNASANCGKMLAELMKALPSSGGLFGLFTGNKSISKFAEDLIPFGESMAEYSSIVDGKINESAIRASANAGKALSELAKTIPNSGGLAGIFAGNNDLGDFAKQLVPFGEAIAEYSAAVAGKINLSAIQISSEAGAAIIEMAKNLPNSGGLAGIFAGNNDMAEFAEGIVPFGEAIAEYSQKVAGIDAGVVEASVSAAQAVAALANELPNTGGMVSWFTGDNNIADFAEDLKPFGENFAAYAKSIEGIDATVVRSTTAAAETLSALANGLPKKGGLFGGSGMSLKDFGSDLSDFGFEFLEYYTYISGISAGVITAVNAELKDLIDTLVGLADFDSSVVTGFATALKDLADAGIEDFLSAFDGAATQVEKAINTLVQAVIDTAASKTESFGVAFTGFMESALAALNAKQQDFSRAGANIIDIFVVGMTSKMSSVSLSMSELLTAALNMIQRRQMEFQTAATQVIEKFASGIESSKPKVLSKIGDILTASLTTISDKQQGFFDAGANLIEYLANGIYSAYQAPIVQATAVVTGIVDTIKDGYQRMFDAGDYLVQGLVNGVNQNAWKAKDAATNLANQLTNTINTALKIHSPSQVAEEQGMFYGEGLVNGLTAAIKPVATAGNDLAKGLEAGVDAGLSAVYAQGYEIGKKIMYNIVEGLKKNTGDLTKAMKEIMDSVIPSTIEAIGGLGDSITAKIKEGIKASDDLGKIMAEKLDVLSEDSEKTLTDLGVKVMEKINEGMQQAKDKIPELLTEILNEITPKILQNIGTASTDLITEKILAGMGEAKGYTDSMKERLTEFFSDMDDPYFELGKQLMTKINEGMQSVKDELPKVLSEIVTEISSKVLESIGSATTESITEKVLKGIEEYGGMSDQLKNKFTGFFPELDEPYFELGKTLMTKINDGMVSVKDVIPGVLKEIITEITGSVLENVGQATMELITGKIMKGITEFQGFSDFMKEKLTGFAPDLDQPMFDIGVKIITKISEGMKSVDGDLELAILGIIGQTIPKVRDAFGDFSDAIVEELKTAMKAFDEFGTMMVEVITSSKDDILNQMQILGAGMVEQMQFGMFEDQMAVFGPINRMMLIALDQVGVLSYDVGSKIIEQLVSGINDHSKNASKAIEAPISTALSGSLDKFKSLGREFMTGILSAPAELLSQSLSSVGEELSEDFYVFGEKIVKNMANGIEVGSKWPIDAIASVASAIINRVRQSYTQFYQAGDYLMQGFANGMRGGTYRVVNAAVEAARAATEAFNRELQIKSPSRVGEKSGGFYTAGIAKGILGGIANITNASRRIATEAKETLDSAMTSVIESLGESDGFHPTITPILDLDDLKQEMTTLDTMFTRNKVMSIGASIEASRSRDVDENQNESEKDKKVQYNFTQNNYSPKALSRLEIYRQSKNLLSAAATKRRATT